MRSAPSPPSLERRRLRDSLRTTTAYRQEKAVPRLNSWLQVRFPYLMHYLFDLSQLPTFL
jgi:hypothetical protein